MCPLPAIPKPARDFESERNWLLRLKPGPETDQRQVEWESDPAVSLYFAEKEYEELRDRVNAQIKGKELGDVD